MKKFSPPEWAAVAVTGAFLIFFAGWMSRGWVSQGWYTVSGSHPEAVTPSPTPRPSFSPDILLDLNAATADDLAGLPGIGKGKAADILDYREAHGRFSSVEELLEVSGIGEATLEAVLPYITVTDP